MGSASPTVPIWGCQRPLLKQPAAEIVDVKHVECDDQMTVPGPTSTVTHCPGLLRQYVYTVRRLRRLSRVMGCSLEITMRR